MRTSQLINWACGLTMGSKLDDIFQAAWSYLPLPDILGFFTTLYPGSSIAYRFSFYTGGADLAPTEAFAAFLIGITLVLIFFIMLGYGLTILTCGQTISFVITYKHREDENLLERKPEEEEAKTEEVEGKVREKLEPEPRV
jgi:predicted membrane protein